MGYKCRKHLILPHLVHLQMWLVTIRWAKKWHHYQSCSEFWYINFINQCLQFKDILPGCLFSRGSADLIHRKYSSLAGNFIHTKFFGLNSSFIYVNFGIKASFGKHIWKNHNLVKTLLLSNRKYDVRILHFWWGTREATENRTPCIVLALQSKWLYFLGVFYFMLSYIWVCLQLEVVSCLQIVRGL